jgi:23S rRNA (cytidine2498-2'-O)-methyltransferase
MSAPVETQMIPWLIRIPEIFSEWRDEILERAGAEPGKVLGDYQMIRMPPDRSPREGLAGLFIPWCVRLEHAWPCDPGATDGFIEKAATALARKFAVRLPRTVWVGTLKLGGGRDWFQRLASNLRGRCLQLFPDSAMSLVDAGLQKRDQKALFCWVGREGLYAGMASPQESNGFYPGGIVHLPKSSAASISRAGAKIAEALHQAVLYGDPPRPGAHWLELGASPGGMTQELLRRGYRVTAMDRAGLDERLSGVEGLVFHQLDVAAFVPKFGVLYDAMVCDMNGDPLVAFAEVRRLAAFLVPDAWIVFTLKTTGSESLSEMVALHKEVLSMAPSAGLWPIQTSHLPGNRREFTIWLRKQEPGS